MMVDGRGRIVEEEEEKKERSCCRGGKTMIAFRTDGRMRREPSVERLSQLLLPLLYERMW